MKNIKKMGSPELLDEFEKAVAQGSADLGELRSEMMNRLFAYNFVEILQSAADKTRE